MTQHSTAIAVPSGDPSHFIALAFLARYDRGTRAGYACGIRQWFEWCHLNDVDPMRAHRAHIETWVRHLAEVRKLKPWTISGRINGVAGMYKFAFLDGHLTTNPAAHIRRPKIHKATTGHGLTSREFADVLTLANEESPTTGALIALLALNGMRLSEVLAVDIEHLDFDRGYRTVDLPHRKGNKRVTLSLSITTAYAVDRAVAGRTSGPLLLGRNGERLHKAAVARTVDRLIGKAGITGKRITPHSFRRTFVTISLDGNVPLRDIMDSTSHTDPAMVFYYDTNKGSIERNATHVVSAIVAAAA